MSKGLVTVFGGSGFIGKHVVRALVKDGWRVRVPMRRPHTGQDLRVIGNVGQVQLVQANIRFEDSVRRALEGSDAVVNLVAVLFQEGKQSFKSLHEDGAAIVAQSARDMGITNFVQMSALGADLEAESLYAQSRAKGEAAVRDALPSADILRPSIVFGPEDNFFNQFAAMTQIAPGLPLIGGGKTKFQPVYVDDVANAAVKGALGEAEAGTYELGGPDVNTFRELMEQMLETIHRRALIIGLPFWVGTAMGYVTGAVSFVTGGLAPQPITVDQVKSLRDDNVVAEGARGFAELGIKPMSLEAVLPSYLWQFRPSGQYAELKESARNLRP